MPTNKIKNQKPKETKANSKTTKKTDAVKKSVSTAIKSTGLDVKVFDTTGKSTGTIKLPEKIFGAKVNKQLLNQALHIYFANQKNHTANTKTRAEVRGGGKKPWRQKGTGNARAGSRRSPLWVGGGITFGPRARETKLDLPKKMKKTAVISALSDKAQKGNIKVITNLEKIQPKTKIMADLLTKIDAKTSVLIVTKGRIKNLDLAARNLKDITIEVSSNLNAFIVWNNKNLLISKESLEKFA